MPHSHRGRALASGVQEVLSKFEPDPLSDEPLMAQQAIYLAEQLQRRAIELQTPQERRQQAELDRMMHHRADKVTLMQLTDQAFRSRTPFRAADQLVHILDVQGIPRFFTSLDRTLLKGFQSFGSYLPGVAVPLVKEKMHQETANVVLPAERELLTAHLRERRSEGVRMNVNVLGEALLGERAAESRLNDYLQLLQLPEIEVISVKVTTLYSQIVPLSYRHSLQRLCDRLELLYRAAGRGTFARADGIDVPKFVYLDMEEYRDLQLTVEAFQQTLERPGLEQVSAGIALQAYLPDSARVQRNLTEWARRRVTAGGAPLTLRVVKGANMEMERVEASLSGWPQAPFVEKVDTDANFKRMLQFGMQPTNLEAVRLGVASHNIFDVAFGLVLASTHDGWDAVQFEMLEGMANHQRRALFELSQNVLLYAPACLKEHFIHAIGYLVRRLDENTGPDNFLRHTFKLQVDSQEWRQLERGFLAAFQRIQTVSEVPRRQQDRQREVPRVRQGTDWTGWRNEPDTDFSRPQNRAWAEQIVEEWSRRCDARATEIPLVIDGQRIYDGREIRSCNDPSRPGVVVGRYRLATGADVRRAVVVAAGDRGQWRKLDADGRLEILDRAANEVRQNRGDLIGAAMADGGKTIAEADPEVSEASDFIEFYARSAHWWRGQPGWRSKGRGVVAVVSPWNFPIAIPCGGVAAALAAGNRVILKPASDAVLPAYLLCECFWRAGVPPDALQFAPCLGREGGQQLVTDDDVDTVILTGGTETAFTMLAAKPRMHLLAETGGKNATIVTAMADRDQAIKHVLHSAFSHSGQKCSATSLLVLEEEVYGDEGFRDALCDAVESLTIGSVWDPHHRVGPLIRPPSGSLERALKELEPGESWAVRPHVADRNSCLVSPAVKWGVAPGSVTHRTEFFGPVLGVLPARVLADAVALVNATGYGLTSALESLDDREQEFWRERVRAGNLYINRPTTGAIVLRQPFGGMGKSSFGPGIKAGGPNYVASLMRLEEQAPELAVASDRSLAAESPLAMLERQLRRLRDHSQGEVASDIDRTLQACLSYQAAIDEEFSRQHDHFRLVGQDNLRRYLPVKGLRIRVHPDDTFFEIFARAAAARVAGCRMTVSVAPGKLSAPLKRLEEMTDDWAGGIEFVEESSADLASVLHARQTERIRYAAPERVADTVAQAAAETGIYLATTPVLTHGRAELLWYFEEQSLSIDYHRYGNLGARAPD